jgi:hypothetical protein
MMMESKGGGGLSNSTTSSDGDGGEGLTDNCRGFDALAAVPASAYIGQTNQKVQDLLPGLGPCPR